MAEAISILANYVWEGVMTMYDQTSAGLRLVLEVLYATLPGPAYTTDQYDLAYHNLEAISDVLYGFTTCPVYGQSVISALLTTHQAASLEDTSLPTGDMCVGKDLAIIQQRIAELEAWKGHVEGRAASQATTSTTAGWTQGIFFEPERLFSVMSRLLTRYWWFLTIVTGILSILGAVYVFKRWTTDMRPLVNEEENLLAQNESRRRRGFYFKFHVTGRMAPVTGSDDENSDEGQGSVSDSEADEAMVTSDTLRGQSNGVDGWEAPPPYEESSSRRRHNGGIGARRGASVEAGHLAAGVPANESEVASRGQQPTTHATQSANHSVGAPRSDTATASSIQQSEEDSGDSNRSAARGSGSASSSITSNTSAAGTPHPLASRDQRGNGTGSGSDPITEITIYHDGTWDATTLSGDPWGDDGRTEREYLGEQVQFRREDQPNAYFVAFSRAGARFLRSLRLS